MEQLDLASMFLLGLLGTGHCLGMCGPLVLALPGTSRGGLRAHLAYHLGRTLTYGLVGAAMGGIGAGLRHAAVGAAADPMGTVARLQVVISLVSALLLLLLGLVRLGIVREPRALAVAMPSRLPGFRAVEARAAAGRLPAILALGLLLGLLPCGLSYAAFSRALAAPDPLSGGVALLAFGLGTVPGLLLLGRGGAAFFRRHARVADLAAGLLLVAMAIRVGLAAALALI